MHIKEIIIDGFKSYAVKTSIQGLDRHFNAITGLNGSGKSNIFDSTSLLSALYSLCQLILVPHHKMVRFCLLCLFLF